MGILPDFDVNVSAKTRHCTASSVVSMLAMLELRDREKLLALSESVVGENAAATSDTFVMGLSGSLMLPSVVVSRVFFGDLTNL